MSFNSRFAWRTLTNKQKEALEKERRAGRIEFGGMGWKAPYLYAQEGSIDPQSAAKAGIQPTFFIKESLMAASSEISGHIKSVL